MTASAVLDEGSTAKKTAGLADVARHDVNALPSRAITVCHPVWRLECGGLERQLLHNIQRLSQEQFKHVIVVRGPGETTLTREMQRFRNVEVVRQTRAGKDRLWSLRLASILRRRSVDVLHVRGLSMLVDAVLAAGWYGQAAVAFSFHGFEAAVPRFRRWRRLAYRLAASRCADRWAVSEAAADAIAAELGLSRSAFGVLPNGVDAGRFTPAESLAAIRDFLGLPPERFVILTIGNLKPIKGHDLLLAALQHLRGDLGQVTLVLVGEDHLCGTMQDWAERNLAGADIRFVGRQDDPLPWYQAADLFVLPSRWEGMSNALLEAMSCGLPVVATAVGGNVDVIDHGRTGLLVRSDSAAELGLAIRWLLKDQPQREALGAAARRYVADRHSATRLAADYAERYLALARRNAALRPRGDSATKHSRTSADLSSRPALGVEP